MMRNVIFFVALVCAANQMFADDKLPPPGGPVQPPPGVPVQPPTLYCNQIEDKKTSCKDQFGPIQPALSCSDFPCMLGYCALPFSFLPIPDTWEDDEYIMLKEVPEDGTTQGKHATKASEPCIKHTWCQGCEEDPMRQQDFCAMANPLVNQPFFTNMHHAIIVGTACTRAPLPPVGGP